MLKDFLCHLFCLLALPITANAVTEAAYDAPTRSLTVSQDGVRRFRYVFNKGGAINGLYDLQIARETNLVGDSFQGETTDRVIQWTYWNSRYLSAPHTIGDKDRRANVTMEGCYGGDVTCDVLQTPDSGTAKTLVFRSRIAHWFYAALDKYGTPNFETTSTYEVLDDGSLQLTRRVLRHPWRLRGIIEKTWDGQNWMESAPKDTLMKADNLWRTSNTSYCESWTPLRLSALPKTRSAAGDFTKEGYRFWTPEELGGWAMAYSDTLGCAVVFGKMQAPKNDYHTQLSFNRLYQPQPNLNILLPAVETDWPDDATLVQTLVLVVGKPDEVIRRVNVVVKNVPAPQIILVHN